MLAEQERFARAVQLWGAAEALRESIRVPMHPVERADYERRTCRFLLNLTIRETALRMGLTETNVKVIQFRALKRAATLHNGKFSLSVNSARPTSRESPSDHQ